MSRWLLSISVDGDSTTSQTACASAQSLSQWKKKFPDNNIEIPMFPFVPLPLDLPVMEGLGRTRQNLLFYSVSPSAFVCTLVCKLRALVIDIINDFPCQLPWNRLGLTVRPRYINWTSDQFLWLSLSVASEQLWKIHRVLPCRDLAVLENCLWCAAGPCVLKFYSSSCLDYARGEKPHELK